MAHKASKRRQKYLEKYPRERDVPLHNERVGELSQITDGADILQLPLLQIPDDVDRCTAFLTVDGNVLYNLKRRRSLPVSRL